MLDSKKTLTTKIITSVDVTTRKLQDKTPDTLKISKLVATNVAVIVSSSSLIDVPSDPEAILNHYYHSNVEPIVNEVLSAACEKTIFDSSLASKLVWGMWLARHAVASGRYQHRLMLDLQEESPYNSGDTRALLSELEDLEIN